MKETVLRVFLLISFSMGMNSTFYSQSQEVVDSIISDSISHVKGLKEILVVSNFTKVPFVVTSITQDKIQLLTEPTIEPLLNSTPGLWMQSGALNTNRISIRGVGYREPFATTGIKVYLDEIPLTNGVGETSIEDIHPLILSGIDIWRGPSSALWGSGLGGMIHLKSNLPETDMWQTRLQAGSFDRFQFDQHLSTKYGKKDQWGTALHYQYLNDGGYRDNNHYRKNSITWLQHWNNDQGWSLNTFIHGIALKAYIPSSLNLSDFENNPSAAAPTWAAVQGNEDYTKWITGLNLRYDAAVGWVYRGAFFGTFFNSDEVRPFNVLHEDNKSYGMRHRFTFRVKQAGHITAGLEFFKEKYDFSTYETLPGGVPGSKLSDQTEHRSYANAFIQSEWTLTSKWYLFAGLTAAVSNLSDDDLETDLLTGIYPTIGLSYALLPKLSIAGTLSRGYSALSLEDILNSDGTINPDIMPETGWSEEISLKFDGRHTSFAKVSFFFMKIENTVITRRIMDDVFEKINGGSTDHAGIELEYSWVANHEKISLEGAYTFGDFTFDEFTEAGTDFSGNQLPGTSKHHAYNRLNFSFVKKLDFFVDHHWLSDVYLNDANSVKGVGYQVFHAGLKYEVISGPKWKGTFSGNVANIFDSAYASMFQINAPGADPRYYYPGKPRSLYLNFILNHNL